MKPNHLINSTSPYLLQHAYNPVEWYPWEMEALDKAKDEDKPIILSIGYSACHWCHVMEHESFEKEEVAEIMNKHFVNIKVDREERPDVDQVYMEAVHAMGLHGGWPLNVMLTPDQKPFYGGTYFRKEVWMKLLLNVADAFKKHRNQLEESALKFTQSLNLNDSKKFGLEDTDLPLSMEKLNIIFGKLSSSFDSQAGGMKKAPKFPLPAIWKFVARYYDLANDEPARQQLIITLDKMSRGGIYDHLKGGFSRYSVDEQWFAPHFEKMLYDNGQLLSVYAEAYQISGKEQYKDVVYQTVEWLQDEMMNEEGGFYSALDADSEGEEGKFYVWKNSELDKIQCDHLDIIKKYYGVTEDGNWENGNNILHVKETLDEYAEKHDVNISTLKQALQAFNHQALDMRSKRVRPGLDDKIITGWNALVLSGLIDAYNAFNEPRFLQMAEENYYFLDNRLIDGNRIKRTFKNGESKIDAYLEDYALVIEALIKLYQATLQKGIIIQAKSLLDYVLGSFFDPDENLFFFTNTESEKLIARKKEIFDNVIPASNSIMAHNLYLIGHMFSDSKYIDISAKMVKKVFALIERAPDSLSNWASLYTLLIKPTAEVAVIGVNAKKFSREFSQKFNPNKIIVGSETPSEEFLLLSGKDKINDKTTIFVCYDKTCQKPVNTVDEALDLVI